MGEHFIECPYCEKESSQDEHRWHPALPGYVCFDCYYELEKQNK